MKRIYKSSPDLETTLLRFFWCALAWFSAGLSSDGNDGGRDGGLQRFVGSK